jgi:hypothetical protein
VEDNLAEDSLGEGSPEGDIPVDCRVVVEDSLGFVQARNSSAPAGVAGCGLSSACRCTGEEGLQHSCLFKAISM